MIFFLNSFWDICSAVSPLKAGERQGWFPLPPAGASEQSWLLHTSFDILQTQRAAKADRNVLSICHIPWLVLTELFGMEMWGGMELQETERGESDRESSPN